MCSCHTYSDINLVEEARTVDIDAGFSERSFTACIMFTGPSF